MTKNLFLIIHKYRLKHEKLENRILVDNLYYNFYFSKFLEL